MSLDLTDLKTIKQLLTYYNLSANKKLGQHFLIDKEALANGVMGAALTQQDFVVEIGPGFGTLTVALADQAGRVLAIETDPKMLAILRPITGGLANVDILPANILNVDPKNIVAKFKEWSKVRKGKTHYKVVSNLPYYITSPIIRFFLSSKIKPELMVLMVQKEVAERITAGPGEMSVLAVSVQFYAMVEIIAQVPKTSFWPKPAVDSAILKISPYDKLPWEVDEKRFFRIVKAGFGERRKQLHNSLAGGLQLDDTETGRVIATAGLDPKIRAQDLSLPDWIKIYEAFNEYEV